MIKVIILLALAASVQSMVVNVTGKNQAFPGSCQQVGCPAGYCCSSFGFCGTTAEYCGTGQVWQGGNGGNGNCQALGCPAGSCCSRFGFCGTSAEHCGTATANPGVNGYGTCQQTGCAAGYCCSRFGFCGNTAEHCAGTGGYVNCGACIGVNSYYCNTACGRKK